MESDKNPYQSFNSTTRNSITRKCITIGLLLFIMIVLHFLIFPFLIDRKIITESIANSVSIGLLGGLLFTFFMKWYLMSKKVN